MTEKEYELLERAIELVGEAGDGAFYLILAWMGQGYFVPILTSATVIVIALVGAKLIRRFAGPVEQEFLNEVRRRAGCRSPYGFLTREERHDVLRAIDRGRNG